MAEGSGNGGGVKLGLFGLMGMVAGSMIGGGIFDLPSNMAASASAGGVILAWMVTGTGMYFLANTFRTLANSRPELSSGIYAYAREGFGRFVGFEMAWGYWLSAAFGNVAFAVLIMDSLSYFFPVFGDGKNWQSVVGGSVLIWTMHFIVLRGVSGAAALNAVATVAKLVPLAVIIVATGLASHWDQFTLDFWGAGLDLGSLGAQVRGTMLVTLWAFIGIEGAVVVSGRARNPALVGQATLLGLFLCLVLYFFLSVLPFAVLTEAELAKLPTPSTAYLLEHIVGRWGAVFVNLSVLAALLSAWLSWTILVAEVPYEAAKDGVFPRQLAGENRRGSPAPALWMSSLVMQATMFVVLFAKDAWLFLLDITGVMVLPPYLASAAFLLKLCVGGDGSPGRGRALALVTGLMGSLYATWLLFAAGPAFLLMSTVLLALGIGLYWSAHRERPSGEPLFSGRDGILAAGLAGISVLAVVLFATGVVRLG